MIPNPTVTFTNGESVEVERVKFIDAGFVGLRTNDEAWVYYPREQIGRVVDE
jgi:hypothetical protein